MIELFLLGFTAHLIGDMIVQTDFQGVNKEHNKKALLQHTLGMFLTFAIVTSPTISAIGWPSWIAFVLTNSITHGIIDMRKPTRWLMRVTRSEGWSEMLWGVIMVDQALHLSILSLSCYVLG
jgi:hypothetical protein